MDYIDAYKNTVPTLPTQQESRYRPFRVGLKARESLQWNRRTRFWNSCVTKVATRDKEGIRVRVTLQH
jgi:hypothetical protein